MTTIDIKLYSIDLEVTGNYSPYERGDGYLTPPSGPDFDIIKIEWDGKDVTDLMESLDYGIIIQEQCIEQIQNQ